MTSKVPRELKEKAKRLGININRVIRMALEKAVEEREMELIEESLEVCSRILQKVDLDRVTEEIRRDRDSK